MRYNMFSPLPVLTITMCTIYSAHGVATSGRVQSLKSPAEASVHFQIPCSESWITLCSGARTPHSEILTTRTCLEKLKVQQAARQPVQVVSSLGYNYGHPVFRDKDSIDEVLPVSEKSALVSIKLEAIEDEALWPELYTDRVDTALAMEMEMHSLNESAEPRVANERTINGSSIGKRSIVQQTVSGYCDDEYCQVIGSDEFDLHDGTSVFYNDKLLCIHAQDQSCIRVRSLRKRGAYCATVRIKISSVTGCSTSQNNCRSCAAQENNYLPIPDCGGAPCSITLVQQANTKGKRQAPVCPYRYNYTCHIPATPAKIAAVSITSAAPTTENASATAGIVPLVLLATACSTYVY